MEIEYQTRMIPIGTNIEQELKNIADEGWTVVDGAQPIAIYHLKRPKGGHAGLVRMGVDESKIHVIKGNGTPGDVSHG